MVPNVWFHPLSRHGFLRMFNLRGKGITSTFDTWVPVCLVFFCSQLHPITSHYIIYGFLDYGYIPLWVGLKIEKYPKPNASHDHYPVFKWLLDGGPTIFSDTPILHHIAIFHSYFRNISQKKTYIYPKLSKNIHIVSWNIKKTYIIIYPYYPHPSKKT